MKQFNSLWLFLKEKQATRWTPILLIAFAGLFPLTWFRDGLIVSYFDEDFPLPPFYNFETYWSAWYRQAAPGFCLAKPLSRLLYASYFVLLNRLGIPLPALQAVYIAGCTLLAGLSMYYLFRMVCKARFSRLGALIAALFYMNNPVLYHIIWRYYTVVFYPAYAVTPLIVVLYIRGVQSGNVLKYASTVTGLLLLASPLGLDLPYATPLVIVFASCVLFWIITSDSCWHAFVASVKFLSVTGILSLLLQSWWLLLFGASIQKVFDISNTFRAAIGSSNLETMLSYSRTTSLVNLFQMQGQLASYTKDVGGTPWSSYDPVYFRPSFVILGFVVPVLAILGLLNKQGGKWRSYWGGLWILVLPAMGGAHPPFGGVYIWFFKNFQYASAYRAFYNKFGLLLPFACSVLVGLGTMLVVSCAVKLSEQRRVRAELPVLLISLPLIGALGVWGYPFWTGEIIAQANQFRAGAKIQVPTYYSDADAWLQKQGQDFRMMILPLPRLYIAAYDWDNGFYGTDPSAWVFSTPTIGRVTTPRSYALPLRIAELINSNKPTNAACLLGLLNVRYILLHGDASWDYVRARGWWVTQPETSEILLKESLGKQAGLQFITTIGQLHFYENTYVLPHTYVAHRLIYLDGGLDAMVSQYTTCDIDSHPAIFLSELDPGSASWVRGIEQAITNLDDLPAITTTMLSPNRYTVHVDNATAPFVLVFGESYDPDWSAEVFDQTVTAHFLVNGYANAWYIEQTGSFDISISFKKQRFVELGFLLSGLGALLTVAVFAIGCSRRPYVRSMLW